MSRKGMADDQVIWAIIGLVVFCGVMVGLAMWGLPKYNAWSLSISAQGRLKAAESEKRIAIETAKAEVESAKLRAEAIKIVGEATKQYPEYRTQEFIGAFAEAMSNGSIHKVIYVPTEANIPIIEAR